MRIIQGKFGTHVEIQQEKGHHIFSKKFGFTLQTLIFEKDQASRNPVRCEKDLTFQALELMFSTKYHFVKISALKTSCPVQAAFELHIRFNVISIFEVAFVTSLAGVTCIFENVAFVV